jgi:hypothetical protein
MGEDYSEEPENGIKVQEVHFNKGDSTEKIA